MKIESPCFIVEEDKLKSNLINFQKALKDNFKGGILGYSFKTNSLPYIINMAKTQGCYAEVVSPTEYALAEKVGFEKNRIIYNGPIKMEEDFAKAFLGDSIINIDSKKELGYLKQLDLKNHKRSIGIRVNIDLERYLPGEIPNIVEGSRFGFSYENGELEQAIIEVKKLSNIHLAGLHMHCGTKHHYTDAYKILTQKACEIAKKYDLNLEYIDVGGGFFGGGDEGAAYQRYMRAIKEVLVEEQLLDLTIIVEPGASVIADPVSFYTTVLDVKSTPKGKFVITDGSRVNIDPFFTKEKYNYEIHSQDQEQEEDQIICGYTCIENDRIMRIKDKSLKVGDHIVYKIVGSYTMCFNPLFIEYFPKVYAYQDGALRLVREKWTVEEYTRKNEW